MNALAEVLNFVLDNLQMCLSNSLKSTLRNLPSAGDVPQSTLPNPPHTGVEINESSVNTFSKGNNIKVSATQRVIGDILPLAEMVTESSSPLALPT